MARRSTVKFKIGR